MKFSVLMSVYYKENALFLDEALRSVYNQTVKPTEVVLVQDGPLSRDLYAVIKTWKSKLNIVDVLMKENVGLGAALNEGLKYCRYDFVARMDTDDIALKKRFEEQLSIFESQDVDVCGSWISEFDNDPTISLSVRRVPENNDDIMSFSRSKNPINHPSVMFKKRVVEECGGYQDVLFFEDYFLWLTLIKERATFYNIPVALVHMRAGYEQLSRRSGFLYFKRELYFYKCCLNKQLLSRWSIFKNIVMRLPIRLLPKPIIAKIYKSIRD